MPMTCDEARQLLQARADAAQRSGASASSDPSGEDPSALTEHLAHCAECSAYWLELLRQRGMLFQPVGTPPQTETPSAPSHAAPQARRKDSAGRGATGGSGLRGFVVVCAVLAGVILIGYRLLEGPGANTAAESGVFVPPTSFPATNDLPRWSIAIEVDELSAVQPLLNNLEEKNAGRIVDTATAQLGNEREIVRYLVELSADQAEETVELAASLGRVLWRRDAQPPSNDLEESAVLPTQCLIELIAVQ